MTNWFIGTFFVAIFIVVIVEVVLNYKKGWKDDAESQGEQVDAESQIQKGDAVSQPQQQNDGKDQEGPVDTENEVPMTGLHARASPRDEIGNISKTRPHRDASDGK